MCNVCKMSKNCYWFNLNFCIHWETMLKFITSLLTVQNLIEAIPGFLLLYREIGGCNMQSF